MYYELCEPGGNFTVPDMLISYLKLYPSSLYSQTTMGKARAYRCSKCPFTETRHRAVAHFYKYHVSLSEAPFYCTLCLFRCTNLKDLDAHVKGYRPHVDKSKLDDGTHCKTSQCPYSVKDSDLIKLSKVDSDSWWAGRKAPAPKEAALPNLDDRLSDILGTAMISADLAAPCVDLDTWLEQAWDLPDPVAGSGPSVDVSTVPVLGPEPDRPLPSSVGTESLACLVPVALPPPVDQVVPATAEQVHSSSSSSSSSSSVSSQALRAVVHSLENKVDNLTSTVKFMSSTIDSYESSMKVMTELLIDIRRDLDNRGALMYVPIPPPPQSRRYHSRSHSSSRSRSRSPRDRH